MTRDEFLRACLGSQTEVTEKGGVLDLSRPIVFGKHRYWSDLCICAREEFDGPDDDPLAAPVDRLQLAFDERFHYERRDCLGRAKIPDYPAGPVCLLDSHRGHWEANAIYLARLRCAGAKLYLPAICVGDRRGRSIERPAYFTGDGFEGLLMPMSRDKRNGVSP